MTEGSITVKVDGQVWYCDSEKVKNQIESITDKEKQKTVLESLSTGANPLVSLDENTFVDTSQISEDDEATEGADEKTSTDNDVKTKGFDEKSYEAFLKSGNLDKIAGVTDKSSAKEIEEAVNQLEAKTEELSSAVDELKNCKSPDEIESVFSTITNLEEALNSISGNCEKAAPEEPKKSSGMGTALGITAGAVGTTWGGIGALAAVALGSNPIGWGIAALGCAVVGGASIAKSMSDSKKSEAYKGYQDVQTKIDELKNDLEEKRTKATENVNAAMPAIMETATNSLSEVFNDDGTLNFSDVTPSSVSDNIKNMQTAQEEMQKYLDVCEKYGIQTDKLSETMSMLMLQGEDGTAFAQTYLDNYAQSLSTTYSGDVVCDTTDFSQLYTELSTLKDEAKASGLDTTALDTLLENISTMNQSEVDDTAQEYSDAANSTGTLAGDVESSMEAAELADSQAAQVDGAASAYDVQTNSLVNAAQNLTTASQEQIDSYVDGIDPSSATSLVQLDDLYTAVNTNLENLNDIGTALDTTGLEGKLEEIKNAKQAIIDNKQSNFENLLDSASTPYECAEVENKINDYISKHSDHDGVDMSGMAALSAAAAAKKDSLQTENIDDEENTAGDETGADDVSNDTNSGDIINLSSTNSDEEVETYKGPSLSSQKDKIDEAQTRIKSMEQEVEDFAIKVKTIINDGTILDNYDALDEQCCALQKEIETYTELFGNLTPEAAEKYKNIVGSSQKSLDDLSTRLIIFEDKFRVTYMKKK